MKLYYYGARYYDPRTSVFLGVDPLADSLPSHSPFGYCLNNPIKLNDPDGNFPIETIWDVGNLFYGITAAIVNHIKGDNSAAQGNWKDAGLDLLAVALPYIPAGSSKLFKVAARSFDAINSKLKVGSQGQKLATKLMKYSTDGKLPTPTNNAKQFNKQKNGDYVHNGTGAVYRKSDTQHKGKTGEYKVFPKGTKEFGSSSKSSGSRVTTDYDGNVLGH